MIKLRANIGGWKRRFTRFSHVPIFPTTIIFIMTVLAICADFIAPYPPNEISLSDKLMPPSWVEGRSRTHLLGTDSLGRDVLSRCIYGARVSLIVASLALMIGAGVGTVIGLISGYSGGLLDSILMRTTDSVIAFPIIFFAFLLTVTMGPSLLTIVIAIGLVIWGRYARLIRAEVLTIKNKAFVDLAKVAGCSHLNIMVSHIFPNVVNTLMVLISLQVGWVIIVEASLSFLGAGIPPPTPSWGNMVADGRGYISTAWWISLFPAILIGLTVLSFNLFGDWLRNFLDPKLKQV